jgi:hypothetical protein
LIITNKRWLNIGHDIYYSKPIFEKCQEVG